MALVTAGSSDWIYCEITGLHTKLVDHWHTSIPWQIAPARGWMCGGFPEEAAGSPRAEFVLKGASKNSGCARADQRDPLRQPEWMEPEATPGLIFRGALKSI